ncbi:MAG: DUF2334 domain-containing protein [Actinomycetota bacterium]
MTALVVSVHDVTPATVDAARRWRELVARRADGPASLLVVPCHGDAGPWRDGPSVAWLNWRAQAGDEVVVHGWTHMTRRGDDGAEMRRLPTAAATRALRDGRTALRRLGLSPTGAIFPAYGAPRRAGDAAHAAGLSWWASRTALRWQGGGTALPAVGLGASTLTRRLLSPPALRPAVRMLAVAPAVRLDLHPADLAHDRLVAAGLRALEDLLAQGRRLVTHEDLLPHRRTPTPPAPRLRVPALS